MKLSLPVIHYLEFLLTDSAHKRLIFEVVENPFPQDSFTEAGHLDAAFSLHLAEKPIPQDSFIEAGHPDAFYCLQLDEKLFPEDSLT